MNKQALVVAVVLVLALGAGAWLYIDKGKQGTTVAARPDAGAQAGGMTEAERAEYVAKNVRVMDLLIGPDTKPGSDEPVPGLLRVHGTVVNSGDRTLDRIELAVFPEDKDGNVLGSYRDNVAGKEPLAPGGSNEFKFQIPENKAFAGTFKHKLQ